MTTDASRQLLRSRDHHATVPPEELLFDLVYVFAITQLSHFLLEHLGLRGGLEALVLWLAVWLGWQYTAWFTNWFNPENAIVRTALFGVMLLSLMCAVVLPEASTVTGCSSPSASWRWNLDEQAGSFSISAGTAPCARIFSAWPSGWSLRPCSGSRADWPRAMFGLACGASPCSFSTLRR